jgi:hypothetical protein
MTRHLDQRAPWPPRVGAKGGAHLVHSAAHVPELEERHGRCGTLPWKLNLMAGSIGFGDVLERCTWHVEQSW